MRTGNKKGFTLVELLVAATIIGILALFAMTAYRNSVAETRWTQAKAQADHVAASVQAMDAARDGVLFSSSQIIVSSSLSQNCTFYSTARSSSGYIVVDPEQLFDCGFLEPGEVANEDFDFYVRTSVGTPLVCVQAKEDAKLPSKYSSAKYCVYEDRVPTETF